MISEMIQKRHLKKDCYFLNIVKSSDICIATTGLHKSIGWKFGEYIAASRAIITEPLYYEIPGELKRGSNYLEFRNVE